MARRIIKTKEDSEGVWDLVAYNEDDLQDNRGYWVKREEDWKQELRVPLACKACGNLIYKWDTQFVNRWGVCATCYVDWLEERPNLPELKSNEARAIYVKAKIEEKRDQLKNKI